MIDEVFDNGWHTGLGFPLKPMVLLEGCTANKPEYYRAVVVGTLFVMKPILMLGFLVRGRCHKLAVLLWMK
jgi:hypothetical protein